MVQDCRVSLLLMEIIGRGSRVGICLGSKRECLNCIEGSIPRAGCLPMECLQHRDSGGC